MKFLLFLFCIQFTSLFAADLRLIEKTEDKILEEVSTEFNKLSPQKLFRKFKILKRTPGESSKSIIKQITLINFNSNKILQETVQIEELKYSNDILVALSSLFTNIYGAGEEQIETNALSKFEGFLVDHLPTPSYRLFSSWSETQKISCYGFYIESKKLKEVLALGSCF